MFFPLPGPFRVSFLDYFKTIWWEIIFGLPAGGIIDHYVPDERIPHLLVRPRKRTVCFSALLVFQRLPGWMGNILLQDPGQGKRDPNYGHT